MATSPKIVSGRVVATIIAPDSPLRGYEISHICPCSVAYSVSTSEIADWQRGHQFTIYLPL